MADFDPVEDAYDKFKKDWQAKAQKSLADRARADEELAGQRLNRGADALHKAATEVTGAIGPLRSLVNELRELERSIHDSGNQIKLSIDYLVQSNNRTQQWWETKANEMKQLLMMAVELGIEVDLGVRDD